MNKKEKISNILLIYNPSVKEFGSQIRRHVSWGIIFIKVFNKSYQRSSKFVAFEQIVILTIEYRILKSKYKNLRTCISCRHANKSFLSYVIIVYTQASTITTSNTTMTFEHLTIEYGTT